MYNWFYMAFSYTKCMNGSLKFKRLLYVIFNLVYNNWFLLTTYVSFFDSSDYYLHMLDLQMVVVQTRTRLTSYHQQR